VADRLTAARFLRRVQTANRAAEQQRTAAANDPATRAAAWRAKFADSRKELKEYFEEAEERRLLDALQRALDYAVIAAAFVPGVGLAISGLIELGNAGISVYRGNYIDAAVRGVFALPGVIQAGKAVGRLASRGLRSLGRGATAVVRAGRMGTGVRASSRAFVGCFVAGTLVIVPRGADESVPTSLAGFGPVASGVGKDSDGRWWLYAGFGVLVLAGAVWWALRRREEHEDQLDPAAAVVRAARQLGWHYELVGLRLA